MKQLLVFVFFVFVIAGCNESKKCEKEIYLIPPAFRGELIVFFDQPDGDEIQYEGKIDIPPEGVEPLEWFLFESKKGYCNY